MTQSNSFMTEVTIIETSLVICSATKYKMDQSQRKGFGVYFFENLIWV